MTIRPRPAGAPFRTALPAAAAALAAAFAVPAGAEELRIAIGSPSDNALNRGMQVFADALAEKSGGAYTGKVFPGTLLTFAESTTGLRDGIADVAYVIPAYTRAEFPNSNLAVDMATASADPVVMSAASTEFMFTCAPCLEEFSEQNQVFLGYTAIGPYYLMSIGKVQEPGDFEGKTYRGFGPFGRWVDAMGAKSVLVASSDIFEAMSQGQIDGNTHTMDVLKGWSIGEIADYVLDAPIGLYLGNALFNVNRDLWDGLDAEQKRLFLEAAAEGNAYTTVKYLEENESYFADPAKGGVEIVEPSPALKEKSEAFRRKDLETVADLNKTEYGIADAHEQVDRMLALIKKWEGLLDGVDRTDVAAVAALYKAELFSKIDPGAL